MSEGNDPINFDRLDAAKRERWQDIRRHREWFIKAAEYWGTDYARTKSDFSADMMQQMHEALGKTDELQDYIARPDVYCAPRLKLPDYR